MNNIMLNEGFLATKALGAAKSGGLLLGSGFLAIGAMLADGNITESTGVAIGFVAGILCAVAAGSWFMRGIVDDAKDAQKRLEKIEKKIGVADELSKY